MSKPRPPRAPDPAQTAAAQTATNRDTAIANAQLNNVNQVTPWGSVNYTSTPGANGIPSWTQTTSLSGNQQQINDLGEQNSIGLGNLANQGINTAQGVLGTDWNQRRFNGQDATGGRLDLAGALGDYSTDVEARSRELAQRGLGTAFDRSEESLRSRLANQGVNAGSDAFGAEMEAFNTGKGNAYAQAEFAARGQALADRGQQVNELTGERGINFGEALQQYGLDDQADFNARSRPLNEITSLNSGSQLYYQPTQAGAPNQYNIANTDVAGITQQGYQNQLGAYNTRMQGQNALLGGLAQLGAAGIQYSDRRLKRDAEYVGTDERGNRIWRYAYLWDEPGVVRHGVMADENPHAAIMTTSGFFAVDYGKL
jgi:hypothetical protein